MAERVMVMLCRGSVWAQPELTVGQRRMDGSGSRRGLSGLVMPATVLDSGGAWGRAPGICGWRGWLWITAAAAGPEWEICRRAGVH